MLSILVFFILYDALFFWLNQTFLNDTIRKVQHAPLTVHLIGAVICYLALSVLMLLTLSWDYLHTFLLGACIYAVYEGTNYAIFQKWPLAMVLLDTLWGGLLFVLVKFSFRTLAQVF